MTEPILANRQIVNELLDQLGAAWEKILNDYAAARDLQTERGGVNYIDGLMVVHNFHKLALDHIAREADMTPEAEAHLYEAAAETFTRAMRLKALQVLGRDSRPDAAHAKPRWRLDE